MCTRKIILLLFGSLGNLIKPVGLLILFSLALLAVALDNAAFAAGMGEAPLPGRTDNFSLNQIAPEGSEIAVVPFLEPGKLCSFSVLDRQGSPVKNASVYLEGELLAADNHGVFNFLVPDRDSFEIALAGEGKRKIARRKFSRGGGQAFLAENEKSSEISAALLANFLDDSPEALKVLYAPSVIVPGKQFSIIGENFSDKIEDNHVDIDGLNAPIISANGKAILAVAPTRLSIGPHKELTVSVAGSISNIAELDVADVFVNIQQESEVAEGESAILKGKIGLNGSNLPVLIRLSNLEPAAATLWSPKQEPMGKNNILLSPGGEKNYFELGVRLLSKTSSPKIEAEYLPLFAAFSNPKVPPALMLAELKSEILRLSRRKIAVESRLEELKLRRNESLQDSDKLMTEKKALSLRFLRLGRMLAARHSIFVSAGGAEDEYRKALDDAASGAFTALNLSVAPIVVVSDGAISGASQDRAPAPVRKGRLLRMLEPPIKLLPPMDEKELAVMKARLEAESGTAGPDASASEVSAEAGLRPSLPEQEPQVSAGSRAPAPPPSAPTSTKPPAGSKSGAQKAVQAKDESSKKGKKNAAAHKSNIAAGKSVTKTRASVSASSKPVTRSKKAIRRRRG